MNRATYLYCLVWSAGTPPLAGAPAGLPGCSPVRLLAVDAEAGDGGGGLWLVAADAPLPDYGSEGIQRRLQDLSWVSERALAHEAVVEHFLTAGTVVPMKLFTLFASDERALEHVRDGRERLDRVLARLADRIEWGVRIQLDEERARQTVAEEARSEAERHSAGKGFLLRKKREQEGVRELSSRLRSEVEAVFTELAEHAAATRRREPPTPEAGSRLLLDAAFLVSKSRAGEFEQLVARCAERLGDRACDVTLTGPWPPYNFIAEEP